MKPLPGSEALARFIAERPAEVLDIGAGEGRQAETMRKAGIKVTTVDIATPADVVCSFDELPEKPYAAIWASHVLEHQMDPHGFLRKCLRMLPEDGLFAVTVPPLKHEIVGGHVTLWNAGLLLYQLILAGFDCSKARVGTYAYNISVIVRKTSRPEAELKYDRGDIETLSPYFPVRVKHGFDGRLPNIRW